MCIYDRVLTHLCERVHTATVWHEPFTHTYLEDVLPADVYTALLESLPPARQYWTGPAQPGVRRGARTFYNLTIDGVRRLPPSERELWRGVTAALTDERLKRCLYERLAPALMQRYGVSEAQVPDLAGYSRPTLYRDLDGYALPPHPDALIKVVTMHLYLPADLSQLHLGTTLYEREADGTFAVTKQLEFRPNSGYAFVVTHQSWHGRETLPTGAGVRHSLLNTFYAEPRREYVGYLAEQRECSNSSSDLSTRTGKERLCDYSTPDQASAPICRQCCFCSLACHK